MANEWGSSGAEKTLRKRARALGIDEPSASLDGLARHLRELEARAPTEEGTARELHASRIADLQLQVVAEETHLELATKALEEEIQRRRTAFLAKLEGDKARRGFLNWVFHVPRSILREWQQSSQESEFRRRKEALPHQLARRQAELRSLEGNTESFVAGHMGAFHSRTQVFRSLLESPDAIGARAENEVIAALRALPDEYWLLNDLHLVATSFMRFNGKPLQSAQIDHLVVGPTGVFVIETKHWSADFAAGADHFDPFEQVGRAGRLAWVLLQEAEGNIPVRTLIATRGSLPPKGKEAMVKVLTPARLPGYIQWFKPTLHAVAVLAIVDVFRQKSSAT